MQEGIELHIDDWYLVDGIDLEILGYAALARTFFCHSVRHGLCSCANGIQSPGAYLLICFKEGSISNISFTQKNRVDCTIFSCHMGEVNLNILVGRVLFASISHQGITIMLIGPASAELKHVGDLRMNFTKMLSFHPECMGMQENILAKNDSSGWEGRTELPTSPLCFAYSTLHFAYFSAFSVPAVLSVTLLKLPKRGGFFRSELINCHA